LFYKNPFKDGVLAIKPRNKIQSLSDFREKKTFALLKIIAHKASYKGNFRTMNAIIFLKSSIGFLFFIKAYDI